MPCGKYSPTFKTKKYIAAHVLKMRPTYPQRYRNLLFLPSIHRSFSQGIEGRQSGFCDSSAIHVTAYHKGTDRLTAEAAPYAAKWKGYGMKVGKHALVFAAIMLGFGGMASAQTAPALPPSLAVQADGAAYADIADLVTISPLIIDATIRNLQKIAPEQAIGVPADRQRMLVEADVTSLIRGQGGITPRVRFLLDVPKDAKGKIPKLKKQRFFLLGNIVNGKPGEIRLSRPNALVQYSPANDALVRGITKEAVLIDAPPKITGIISAFYSAGTVLGEGETQIFLRTAKEQPLSLSILSRPGQEKRWAVSTAEVIDESASAPAKFTLLWYRLACELPRALSPDLVEAADSDNAARAQADYKFVLDSLGPCGRKR
jgi:hypothetical protein